MSVPMGGGPQVNKFEEVSNDGHQVSLVGVGLYWGGPMSDVHVVGAGTRMRGPVQWGPMQHW